MRYAFDWGGTLNENPELMEIAKALLAAGHEVYVLSVAWPDEDRRNRVERHDIPFTGVYVIEEKGNTQHGVEKVKLMRQLGCTVIFDDNEDVIKHARQANLLAIKVPYEKKR